MDVNQLVLDHLKHLIDSKRFDLEKTESVEVALDCLQGAFGLQANSGGSRLEELVKASSGSSAGTAKSGADEDAELKKSPLFKKFLSTVTDRGFFGEHKEGSSEYNKRLQKVITKFKSRVKPTPKPAAVPAPASATSSTQKTNVQKGDDFKEQGNVCMKNKDYKEASEFYTKAITICPTGKNSHIYYSNRAAALIHLKDYEKAANDASASIALNPKYVKAHTRLASAQLMLGLIEESIQSCNKALTLDPTNVSAKETLAEAKKQRGDSSGSSGTSNSSPSMPAGMPGMPGGMPGGMGGMAEMMQNMMGGGAGAGGMPDFGSIMQNPAFMQMAQNMMSNPQMMQMAQNMMSNPAMANLASQFQNQQQGGNNNNSNNNNNES